MSAPTRAASNAPSDAPSSKFVPSLSKELLHQTQTSSIGELNTQDKPFVTLGSRPSSEAEMNILVFGPTGSGKSTFINLASGPGSEKLEVSDSLESCTRELKPVTYTDANQRRITLIDSPGFDDTSKDDSEIVRSIATFLKDRYETNSSILHGMIYLHRISDSKMTRSAVRSWEVFTLLCGNYALKNAVIVTNRWETVSNDSGAEGERERQLLNKYFKVAIDQGARSFRYHNSFEDLTNIIEIVSRNTPTPLAIQAEMVILGNRFEDTIVGKSVGLPPSSLSQSPDSGVAASNKGYLHSTAQSPNDNNDKSGPPEKWYNSWKLIGNCERVAVMYKIWKKEIRPVEAGFDDPSDILVTALNRTFEFERLENKEDCRNWVIQNPKKFRELQNVIKGSSIKNKILNGIRKGTSSQTSLYRQDSHHHTPY